MTASPFRRSIGLSGLLSWIIAVGGMIAVGTAFSEGNRLLGAVGLPFFVAAVSLAIHAWRARRDAGGGASPAL